MIIILGGFMTFVEQLTTLIEKHVPKGSDNAELLARLQHNEVRPVNTFLLKRIRERMTAGEIGIEEASADIALLVEE